MDQARVDQLLNVRFTFSRYCISGIVKDCGCRRCHEERGEPHDDAAEAQAQFRSEVETKRFREQQMEWARVNEMGRLLEHFYELEELKLPKCAYADCNNRASHSQSVCRSHGGVL